jgi:hypothetical protein
LPAYAWRTITVGRGQISTDVSTSSERRAHAQLQQRIGGQQHPYLSGDLLFGRLVGQRLSRCIRRQRRTDVEIGRTDLGTPCGAVEDDASQPGPARQAFLEAPQCDIGNMRASVVHKQK